MAGQDELLRIFLKLLRSRATVKELDAAGAPRGGVTQDMRIQDASGEAERLAAARAGASEDITLQRDRARRVQGEDPLLDRELRALDPAGRTQSLRNDLLETSPVGADELLRLRAENQMTAKNKNFEKMMGEEDRIQAISDLLDETPF